MEGLSVGKAMVLAAIPARFGSSRFPGKPLATLLDRPMIAWVVGVARSAQSVDEVMVVTDHDAIARAATEAGARAITIDREAPSGSDRIAQLLEHDSLAGDATIIVNLQGDEPLLEPAAIDAAVEALKADTDLDIVTLVRPLGPDEDATRSDLVKVDLDDSGRALSFSRSPIPHGDPVWIHIGLYVYRRDGFDRFVAAGQTERERAARLEQLRALEIGLRIGCVRVASESLAVDSPDDVAPVEAVLRARMSG